MDHIVFPALTMTTAVERWPIAQPFTIARGTKTEAVVVTVEVSDGSHRGRGECVPYARYGETVESVVTALDTIQTALHAGGIGPDELLCLMQKGAARNALDCALWDFEAKKTMVPVWERAALARPTPVRTAYTISLADPESMAHAAARAADVHSLLKIKLGGGISDITRLEKIREAVPRADLIVDVNEGWSAEELQQILPKAEALRILLIEQPLSVAKDETLAEISSTVPICADESAHDSSDISVLADRYDAVNIKLDKTGGFTEALAMYQEARKQKMHIAAGCMVATSLSMAPALLLAGTADFVDLDGALLLAKDINPGLEYSGEYILPPQAALWG